MQVFAVPLAGGVERAVLPPGPAAPAPSPDGKWLAYTRGKLGEQVIVVRDLPAGGERVLAAELPRGMWRLRVSHDGRRWSP